MNDKYVVGFCKISHIAMQILIYEKSKRDVVLRCLLRDIEINDDAGILHPNQCDCSKFMEMLKKIYSINFNRKTINHKLLYDSRYHKNRVQEILNR